ncbi:MAG: GAF domain-containing protein [Bacteroidetes bacterium]|nr:GAF domain-containing protein [Bacteroidota bacterium]
MSKKKDKSDKTLFRQRSWLESQVLYDIMKGVTTTDNLNDLLTLIHDSLSRIIYAENCFVALHDENTGLFSFPYFVDKYDPKPEPLNMSRSCTAFVYRTGEPLLLTEQEFDDLCKKNEVELVGSRSPSWLGVPLRSPSRTIGVLVVQHYEEEGVFSKEDVQFLDFVASQIAIAIQRKRDEDELRESEEMFRALFNESADANLLLDETGFINCNTATVAMLGFKNKEEFLHKSPWELSPERQNDGMLSGIKAEMMIKTAIENGFHKFEWTHTKADGSDLPVEVMLTPVHIKGKQFLYTIWRDISDRKKAESEIKQKNEQLTRLNAEKDRFLSIIAHDLRSPFQTLWGLTEVMSDEEEHFTAEQYANMSSELNRIASNLFRLLRDLLEWAQSQNGTLALKPVVFTLSDLIEEVASNSAPRAKQKGISIKIDAGDRLSVFADRKMINSVLNNLVSNALKFTHRGGQISIGTEKLADGMLKVSVSDNGTGMTQEVVSKLFNPGEKTGSLGTEGELSTGLGLLICKEFVENNGGQIMVESVEGQGSKFSFTLKSADRRQ